MKTHMGWSQIWNPTILWNLHSNVNFGAICHPSPVPLSFFFDQIKNLHHLSWEAAQHSSHPRGRSLVKPPSHSHHTCVTGFGRQQLHLLRNPKGLRQPGPTRQGRLSWQKPLQVWKRSMNSCKREKSWISYCVMTWCMHEWGLRVI